MRRKKQYQPKKVYRRVNHQIRAEKLRVIDEGGKQIGLLSKHVALKKAKEKGLDLVEIAPNAKPPVAKIVDIGKFRYQEEKKLKKQSKTQKGGELKEIRFSPFIGEKDYETRKVRVNEFLKDGYKIRAVVKFKGRQMGSKQFGYKLLQKLLEDLEQNIVVDMEPKFLGRHLAMVISPTNKKSDKPEKQITKGEVASKKRN